MDTRKPARISREKAHEMLGKSFAEGLAARPSRHAGEVLVQSSRDPRVSWRVRSSGCPCEGFARHGYCKHFVRAAYEARIARGERIAA